MILQADSGRCIPEAYQAGSKLTLVVKRSESLVTAAYNAFPTLILSITPASHILPLDLNTPRYTYRAKLPLPGRTPLRAI